MYIIYLLINEARDKTYIGFTDDLARRIKEHKNQKVKTTKNFKNFSITKIEEIDNIRNARQREKYWKSGAGRKKLKNIFRMVPSSNG